MKTLQCLRKYFLAQSCFTGFFRLMAISTVIGIALWVNFGLPGFKAHERPLALALKAESLKAKELFRPTEAMFHVQNEDIAVSVLRPILDESSTTDRLVIIGYNPTVIVPDSMKIVGTPQCHWDGVNENTRWAYTIYLRQGPDGKLSSHQLNLADFMAVSPRCEQAPYRASHVIPMGIISDNNTVEFTTMPFEKMNSSQGMNPWEFVETE